MSGHAKHGGWWADGEQTPTVDFDHGEIDSRLNGESHADPKGIASEVLGRILLWVWSGHGNVNTARIRIVALTCGLRPDILRNRSYTELACDLGVTADAVCKMVKRAQDAFGVKFGRTYGRDRRAVMAKAQRARRARERRM